MFYTLNMFATCFSLEFSLNIFYFQQITSNTVQYIQFIRKLGLERKRKPIEFFSYYRVHSKMAFHWRADNGPTLNAGN